MKNIKRVFLVMAAIVISGTTAFAYSVSSQSDHGSTVQVNLTCDNGSKKHITYNKSTGDYCTPALSCNSNMSKVARWACSE